MKILQLSSFLTLRNGGIPEVIRPLSRSLVERHAVEVEVLGLADRERPLDEAAWRPARVHQAPFLGPSSFGLAPGMLRRVAGTDADLLHTHGLWTFPSLAARLARGRRPYVVSPHGMLEAWALAQSTSRKRLAAAAYERAHLEGAACLHALSASEADAIRAFGLTKPIAIIPNGVDLPEPGRRPPPPAWRSRLPEDARILLFLGRIHPKKGLAELVEAWCRMDREKLAPPWHLVIAGMGKPEDEAGLRRHVAATGAHDIHLVGPQVGAEKRATFEAAHAFVLPSKSEGLPMAVLEAWAHGLPVMMTPECNLGEGFAAGAAERIGMEPDAILPGLERVMAMPEERRQLIGAAGLDLVGRRFTWAAVAESFLAVYRWALGGGMVPECVAWSQRPS